MIAWHHAVATEKVWTRCIQKTRNSQNMSEARSDICINNRNMCTKRALQGNLVCTPADSYLVFHTNLHSVTRNQIFYQTGIPFQQILARSRRNVNLQYFWSSLLWSQKRNYQHQKLDRTLQVVVPKKFQHDQQGPKRKISRWQSMSQTQQKLTPAVKHETGF